MSDETAGDAGGIDEAPTAESMPPAQEAVTRPARPTGTRVQVPRWLAVVVAVLVLGGSGFAIGRLTAPNRGVERLVERGSPTSPAPSPDGRQTTSPVLLGVSVRDATGAHHGAQVLGVASGSPAGRAGLRAGDVVTAVDGRAVKTSADLRARLSGHKAGDQVTITYRRAGKSAKVRVRLANRFAFSPPRTPQASSRAGTGRSGLDATAIAAQVDPAVVKITSTLGYQHGEGAGTGVVLTASGEILTNNHVIEGATAISVTIEGRTRTYTATVLGADPTDDVALIQIQGVSGLKTVAVGDSSKVTVGEPVVAIGNALNLPGPPSVTGGTVTGVDRSITVGGSIGGAQQLTHLIQTDAALQPGDSGGPLVDAAARVIGMNTAADTANTNFESGSNTGFAIPINQAVSIAQQIETGHPTTNVEIGPRGFLGVQVQDANLGESTGGVSPAVDTGALVIGVVPGSPAQSAGLTSGDVIVSFDHNTVDSAPSLTHILPGHHPGDTVEVEWVDQSGRHHTASVHLTTGPAA